MDNLFDTLYEMLAEVSHQQKMAALSVAHWLIHLIDRVYDDTAEREIPVYIPLHPMTSGEIDRVKPKE